LPLATRAAASESAAPLAARARAKVNLYLHVLGRRADGYHELDSLVVFADAGDALRAVPAATLSLTLDGPFAAALAGERDNLVLRAARALAASADAPPGAALHLTKTLPVASGLGGGSADAAAALRLLARLWRLRLDAARLHAIARGLGADVPVCLAGRAAFVGGIGERLDPAPALPPAGLVLVNPGVPLATPSVFKARAGAFSSPGRFDSAPRDACELASLLAARANDLTEAATVLVPAVGEVLAALAASPDCLLARMSGSGATCFGLYRDAAAAARAAAWLAGRRREWWVAPTALASVPGVE
jgi:4-diphosphocytidyl-2-C-methyl-D-erythritol kinase